MGNIRAGTLMKFTKLLIANVSPGILHYIGLDRDIIVRYRPTQTRVDDATFCQTRNTFCCYAIRRA